MKTNVNMTAERIHVALVERIRRRCRRSPPAPSATSTSARFCLFAPRRSDAAGGN